MGKYVLQLLQDRYHAGSQGDDTHSLDVTSLDLRVLKMEEFIDDTSRRRLRASDHHRVVQEVSSKKVTLIEFAGIFFYRVPANGGTDSVVAAASVIPVVSSNLNPAEIVTRLQNTNNEKLQRVDAACVNGRSSCSINFGGEDAVVAASSKSGFLDMGLGAMLGIIALCVAVLVLICCVLLKYPLHGRPGNVPQDKHYAFRNNKGHDDNKFYNGGRKMGRKSKSFTSSSSTITSRPTDFTSSNGMSNPTFIDDRVEIEPTVPSETHSNHGFEIMRSQRSLMAENDDAGIKKRKKNKKKKKKKSKTRVYSGSSSSSSGGSLRRRAHSFDQSTMSSSIISGPLGSIAESSEEEEKEVKRVAREHYHSDSEVLRGIEVHEDVPSDEEDEDDALHKQFTTNLWVDNNGNTQLNKVNNSSSSQDKNSDSNIVSSPSQEGIEMCYNEVKSKQVLQLMEKSISKSREAEKAKRLRSRSPFKRVPLLSSRSLNTNNTNPARRRSRSRGRSKSQDKSGKNNSTTPLTAASTNHTNSSRSTNRARDQDPLQRPSSPINWQQPIVLVPSASQQLQQRPISPLHSPRPLSSRKLAKNNINSNSSQGSQAHSLQTHTTLASNGTDSKVTIYCPPGKIGILIDSPTNGKQCLIHGVKETSVLHSYLLPGDALLSIDEVDVRLYSPITISKLLSKRAKNPVRKITVLRHVSKVKAESLKRELENRGAVSQVLLSPASPFQQQQQSQTQEINKSNPQSASDELRSTSPFAAGAAAAAALSTAMANGEENWVNWLTMTSSHLSKSYIPTSAPGRQQQQSQTHQLSGLSHKLDTAVAITSGTTHNTQSSRRGMPQHQPTEAHQLDTDMTVASTIVNTIGNQKTNQATTKGIDSPLSQRNLTESFFDSTIGHTTTSASNNSINAAHFSSPRHKTVNCAGCAPLDMLTTGSSMNKIKSSRSRMSSSQHSSTSGDGVTTENSLNKIMLSAKKSLSKRKVQAFDVTASLNDNLNDSSSAHERSAGSPSRHNKKKKNRKRSSRSNLPFKDPDFTGTILNMKNMGEEINSKKSNDNKDGSNELNSLMSIFTEDRNFGGYRAATTSRAGIRSADAHRNDASFLLTH